MFTRAGSPPQTKMVRGNQRTGRRRTAQGGAPRRAARQEAGGSERRRRSAGACDQGLGQPAVRGREEGSLAASANRTAVFPRALPLALAGAQHRLRTSPGSPPCEPGLVHLNLIFPQNTHRPRICETRHVSAQFQYAFPEPVTGQ